MIIAAIGAALNIGLDFLLVYGLDGYVEPMGVEGAAWASLIAQMVMAILALIFILKKTAVSLRLRFPMHPEVMRLLFMSLNLFLRSVALNTALVLATREATALGKEYIAAHTIAFNIWLFAAFFVDGYGAAGNILGGKLLGEKNYPKLVKLTKRVNIYNLGVSVLLIIMGFIFYEPLGLLFNKDETVLSLFYGIFILALASLPLNSIAFTLDAIFTGLGEMGILRNVLLASTFLGFVPVLYASKYLGWGLTGIWIAILVWVAFRGAALWIKFRRKYYKLAQTEKPPLE